MAFKALAEKHQSDVQKNASAVSTCSHKKVEQHAGKAVLWKILSCLCFAILNALVRYLTGGSGSFANPLSPSQLTFLQNVVGCVFLIPWIMQHGISSLKTSMPGLHTLRVIAGVSGIIMLYYAFKHMPVAQAVSLQFTGPVFTALGAWIYLRESLGPLRVAGIILGLVGAFIITRPDRAFAGNAISFDNWMLLFPVGSAFAFAAAKLIGRELSLKGESANVLTTYLVFFMVPASFGPALYDWAWPQGNQWLYVFFLGFFAWAGHFSMAKSYGLADVVFLTPFGFSRILFSAVIAYLAFYETPASTSFWFGAAIIMMSAFLITLGEEKLKKNGAR